MQINATLKEKRLTLVGWYHSHPISAPNPSQKDIVSQKAYQDVVRKSSGDEASIGIIIS